MTTDGPSEGYVALRFDAAAADADAWSDALLEAGALSVDVSDPHAGTPLESPLYGEPGLPVAGSWAWSRVIALFAADGDWRAALEAAAEALAVAVPPHETYPVAEQDWVRNTQAQFGPIEIAPGFWVVPSWSDVPDAAARRRCGSTLASRSARGRTRPRGCASNGCGRSCGTGETVLDYGCGSGILAIAAGKLGAGRVAGVDVDPQALRASEANARANGVGARFVAPRTRLAAGSFDIVVANILANPLILLAPRTARRVSRSRDGSRCRAFSSIRRTRLPPPTRRGLNSGSGGSVTAGYCSPGSAARDARRRRSAAARRRDDRVASGRRLRASPLSVPPASHRWPTKNSHAAPVARRFSASPTPSWRCATARSAAAIAGPCSTVAPN